MRGSRVQQEHKCLENLEEFYQVPGLKMDCLSETRVVGIKYKCRVCGKLFAKVVEARHHSIPQFCIYKKSN